jgi:signal transduction histidine kinase/response regulator of citrate/malate metabolism
MMGFDGTHSDVPPFSFSMRRYLRARYLAPAIIALVMIVYGAVTAVRNTRANLAEFKGAEHARVVIEQVHRCTEALLSLETGHRGYVLTGQLEFLEPYDRASGSLDNELGKLADLTLDNPAQHDRVQAIQAIAEKKQAELAKGVDLMKAGKAEEARSIIATGDGRRMTEHFRSVIDELHKEELMLITKRQIHLTQNLKDTRTIVVVTAAIAIAAGVVGSILLTLFLMSKERQERLLFEREKAVQADRAKTDFLAMMSHEIRTPMNAILGFGELLHDMAVNPREKHFAKAIITSGNSLLTLINDILDLSKIEARKMDLHPETVEMKRFADNLETLFSFRAQEKGLEFRVRLDPSIPPFLSFDALRFRQVLVNLIGNAVKFTRKGHVRATLRAESRPSAAGDVTLHFEVSDTGIGIAGDQVREIFRPFYQVESEQGRRFQGTGLGLSICDRLVKLMGGRIEVKSQLGKGTVFRVSIPVQGRMERMPELLAADAGPGVDFNRLAPATILVVDHVPLNRELIRGYLHGTDHQVLEAETGEQAVTLCRRHLPDLVLMDIRTPAVDGRTVQATLKSEEATGKIPLIAVTAPSLPDTHEEPTADFDGLATKPISRERLYLELAKFLPVKTTAATGRPVPEEPVVEIAHAREWPELKAGLEDLRDSALPGLIELVPAQATLRFARQLTDLARAHDCPPLAEYATLLERAAGDMDFAEAGRLLAVFPGLIDTLSHADL